MAEKKEKENSKTTKESGDSQEKSPEGEQTPEKAPSSPEEIEKANKQLYARTKKAEERAKELEEKLEKREPSDSSIDDIEKFAKVSSVFDGLDSKERTRLIKEARQPDGSFSLDDLEEAKESEDFVLWQKAHKQKVEEDKTPPPSTKNTPTEGPKDLDNMSQKEREAVFRRHGWVKDYRKPVRPQREE